MELLKIAVCDDSRQELKNINNILSEYFSTKDYSAEVKLFSTASELLFSAQSEFFDIYILDVVIPNIDGIKLGTKLREFDKQGQIIYVTTEPQFALHAYSAQTINYLIKPVQKNLLVQTIELCIQKFDLVNDRRFVVKTTNGLYPITPSKMLCIANTATTPLNSH